MWNLLIQYPTAFEINEAFLLQLASEGGKGARLYGDFFYDTDKKRKETKLSETTLSIFDVLLARDEFKNPLYQEYRHTLFPITHPGRLRLWPALSFGHKPLRHRGAPSYRSEFDRICSLERKLIASQAQLRMVAATDDSAARMLELQAQLASANAKLKGRPPFAIKRASITRSERAMTLGFNDAGGVALEHASSPMMVNLKTLAKLQPGDKVNSATDYLSIDRPSLLAGLVRSFRTDSRGKCAYSTAAQPRTSRLRKQNDTTVQCMLLAESRASSARLQLTTMS